MEFCGYYLQSLYQMYLIKRFLFKPINKVLEQRRAMADSELQEARRQRNPLWLCRRNMSRT